MGATENSNFNNIPSFFLHGGALKISDMLCYGEGGDKICGYDF